MRPVELLGHVVGAVEVVAGQVGGPRLPDAKHVVVVEVGEIVASAPEHEERTRDLPSSLAVSVIGRAVDAKSGPVVLAHRMLHRRVSHRVRDIRVSSPHHQRRTDVYQTSTGLKIYAHFDDQT